MHFVTKARENRLKALNALDSRDSNLFAPDFGARRRARPTARPRLTLV